MHRHTDVKFTHLLFVSFRLYVAVNMDLRWFRFICFQYVDTETLNYFVIFSIFEENYETWGLLNSPPLSIQL